jgi:protein arginine kinase activator
MECERCKKNDATFHLTEIIKDVKSEVHLCETCAREVGFNAKLSNFNFSMPEMLSFLDLAEIEGSSRDSQCKSCGFMYRDYSRTGRLGCPDCYEAFRESLTPFIVGFHGEMHHRGKSPRYSADSFKEDVAPPAGSRGTLEELTAMMEAAVAEERYEDAAVIRDRLREMMKQGVES